VTTQEWQRCVAQLMRESADLVEAGVVQVTQVDVEYDVRQLRGFADFVPRSYFTGLRTVVLRLVGCDGARWEGAARGPGDPALPVPPSKCLGRE
jgi:hypothetical protein